MLALSSHYLVFLQPCESVLPSVLICTTPRNLNYTDQSTENVDEMAISTFLTYVSFHIGFRFDGFNEYENLQEHENLSVYSELDVFGSPVFITDQNFEFQRDSNINIKVGKVYPDKCEIILW